MISMFLRSFVTISEPFTVISMSINLPSVAVEKSVPDFSELLFVRSNVQSLKVRPKGAARVLSPVVTGLL